MRRIASFVSVVLATAACSGGGDSTTDTTATTVIAVDGDRTALPPEPAQLAGVTLSARTAGQLDRVGLDGLEDDVDVEELEVRLTIDSGERVAFPVYRDDEQAYIVAPLHPLTPVAGGSVELRLSDGTDESAALTLELDGLPVAPGAWDDFVAALIFEVDQRAVRSGSSFEQLQALSFENVAPELIVLKLVQDRIDNGTDEDLESFASTASTDDDRQFLDAIIARVEPTSLVRSDPIDGPDGFARPNGFARPAAVAPSGPTSSRRQPAQIGACVNGGPAVGSPQALAEALAIGTSAVLKPGDPAQKVLDDIAMVTTAGSLIPGIGTLIGGIGAGFGAIELLRNFDAGTYPSRLTSLDASVSRDVFAEDFTEPGTWNDVMVVAESTGYQLDIDLTRTLADAVRADGRTKNFKRELLEAVAKAGITSAGIAFLEGSGDALVNYCPQSWMVNITGEPYSTGRAVLGRFTVDSSLRSYVPKDVIFDTLRIQSNGEVFSGQNVSKTFDVDVKPIVVTVNPTEVYVDDPGQMIDIEARIANAELEALFWDAQQGEWADGLGASTNGPMVRPLQTPGDPDAYPFLVVVESLSRYGLREDGDPPRVGIVIVNLAKFIVTPSPGSVSINTTLQFAAASRTDPPVEVRWTATGGTIDPSSGLYVAGDQPGTFQVTATSVANSAVSVTVVVNVVDDSCLTGDWVVEQGELNRLYQAISEDVDDTTITVQGQILMSFDGASYTYVPDFTLRLDIDTGSDDFRINADATLTGSMGGGYTADGGIITTTNFQSDIQATIRVGSQVIDGTETVRKFFSVSPINSAPYDCSGPNPVIMFSTGTGRIPITLRPA